MTRGIQTTGDEHELTTGDWVRIDIPDRDDSDFSYHGTYGEVVMMLTDDAGIESGESRDSMLYRIELNTREIVDFRWRDLHPVSD